MPRPGEAQGPRGYWGILIPNDVREVASVFLPMGSAPCSASCHTEPWCWLRWRSVLGCMLVAPISSADGSGALLPPWLAKGETSRFPPLHSLFQALKSRPEQRLAYTSARPVPALKQRRPTHAFRAPVSKGRVSLILLRKRYQFRCLRPFEGPCPQCHAEATAAAHAHVTGRRRPACRSQRLCSRCSC